MKISLRRYANLIDYHHKVPIGLSKNLNLRGKTVKKRFCL